ncbi:alpha/beta hydrolase [Paenibacillus sp. IB182496]|uniref:Alpha/beta hydrolase n=1 Tax=Paenibacillus sabuli TaxID=2772509 RepID=A0A927GRH7_9BACL|nr:alpha/beta hydrolase [Paenibacillus sabuli]MBD2845654.1 alpha/beta hydrolase [Paenibacillus sabuli]
MELWPEGAPHAAGSGDEDRPAITAYPAPGARSAVIVCPGGGYSHRAQHEGEPIAQWLNTLGVSAYVLRYRVAPYRYPCALLDVQRAVRTVRAGMAAGQAEAPELVGVLGFSAGGHLTATAGTHYDNGDPVAEDPIERHSCRPDAIVLCYPVVTLQDPYAHAGSRTNLLGEEPDPELVASLSNETQVTPDTPPTFLWHTSEDGAVPVENSLLFAGALSRSAVPFDLHVYDHGGHGLGLAGDDSHIANWSDVCGKWLKTRGFYS